MATCFNAEAKTFLRCGNELFDFMKSIVSCERENCLQLISRTFHHVRTESYECFCFECILKNLVYRILVERNDLICL